MRGDVENAVFRFLVPRQVEHEGHAVHPFFVEEGAADQGRDAAAVLAHIGRLERCAGADAHQFFDGLLARGIAGIDRRDAFQ